MYRHTVKSRLGAPRDRRAANAELCDLIAHLAPWGISLLGVEVVDGAYVAVLDQAVPADQRDHVGLEVAVVQVPDSVRVGGR